MCALAFAVIARGVYLHHVFAFDAPVLTWLHAHQSSVLTRVALLLTRIGDPTTVAAATALVLLTLLVARRLRDGLAFALEVGGAAVLDLAGKHVFARPRPALYPHLVHESDFGFPSGHAMGDIAFFLALLLLLGRVAPRWRPASVLGLALAVVIGASRPYLQVHYPTDILAGWALGFAWTLALDLLVAPAPAPRVTLAGGVWARAEGRRGAHVRVWGRRHAEPLTSAALLDRVTRAFGPDVDLVIDPSYQRQLRTEAQADPGEDVVADPAWAAAVPPGHEDAAAGRDRRTPDGGGGAR